MRTLHLTKLHYKYDERHLYILKPPSLSSAATVVHSFRSVLQLGVMGIGVMTAGQDAAVPQMSNQDRIISLTVCVLQMVNNTIPTSKRCYQVGDTN